MAAMIRAHLLCSRTRRYNGANGGLERCAAEAGAPFNVGLFSAHPVAPSGKPVGLASSLSGLGFPVVDEGVGGSASYVGGVFPRPGDHVVSGSEVVRYPGSVAGVRW